MGIHIAIEKRREDRSSVDYEFRLGERSGFLRLDKRTGAALLIDVDPRDEMAFRSTARKLIDHWHRGEYPERTSWAA